MPMTEFGHVGRDAELRYTPGPNSVAVINVPVGVNYGRKDQQTGRRPTQWVEISIWGQQAESLCEYMVKGQGVQFTIDDVHIEEFTYQGEARSKLVGRAIAVKLVGGAPDQSPQQQQQPQRQQTRQQSAPQQQRQQSAPQQRQQAAPQPQPDFDNFDDDIPF